MVRAVRRRYLALAVEPPVPPPRLEEAVLRAVRPLFSGPLEAQVRPRLYHLRPGAAIVRLDPSTQRAAREALDGMRVGDARVRTVATSGTLRQAKAALGVRQSARRRRRPARAKAGPARPGPGRTAPGRSARGAHR